MMEVILSDAKNAVNGDVLDKIPRHELMLTIVISNGSNCFSDVTDDTIDTSDVGDDVDAKLQPGVAVQCWAGNRATLAVNTGHSQVSFSQCRDGRQTGKLSTHVNSIMSTVNRIMS